MSKQKAGVAKVAKKKVLAQSVAKSKAPQGSPGEQSISSGKSKSSAMNASSIRATASAKKVASAKRASSAKAPPVSSRKSGSSAKGPAASRQIPSDKPGKSSALSSSGLRDRAGQIIALLKQMYPDAKCSLRHHNPLELLVATILSAQCTDDRVNIVTKDLFQKYRTAADYAGAPMDELQKAIQSTGFYRNKAKSIHAMAQSLLDKHNGDVPATMEQLVQLAGVGRKTANVVLGNAFGINEGVVVDTHVGRLSQRLDLTRQSDPVKVEQDLVKLIPRDDWTVFSHLLIYHGRAICQARKPKCDQCKLNDLCPKRGV